MKKIKDLKSGLLKRNLSVAKIAFNVGKDYFTSKGEDILDKASDAIGPNSQLLLNELGMMKGSIMKAGQMLSVYGDYFLPREVNDTLKKLQNQSFFLSFEKVSKNVSPELLTTLKLEEEPFAAASIGQVHKALDLEGRIWAVKIQYPSIRKAINSDMLALKLILKSIKKLPGNLELDPFLDEVKEMLIQEMDYKQEISFHQKFIDYLEEDKRYKVPLLLDELCSDHVVVSEFLEGHRLDTDIVSELSQEKRNELAYSFLDLFFKELFEWKLMQTDPHYGNYLVLIENDSVCWGLLDFGASKDIPLEISRTYFNLMSSCVDGNKELYFKTLIEMNYFKENTDPELLEGLWSNASKLGIPYQGEYDWGCSTLPDELISGGLQLIGKIQLKSPPKEVVFLDRKVGGVFMVLKQLGAIIDANLVFEKYRGLF